MLHVDAEQGHNVRPLLKLPQEPGDSQATVVRDEAGVRVVTIVPVSVHQCAAGEWDRGRQGVNERRCDGVDA